MRKYLDDFLFWLIPDYWLPLYNSVSFTHMPYKRCIENRAWQNQVLSKAVTFAGVIGACGLAIGAFKVAKTFLGTSKTL